MQSHCDEYLEDDSNKMATSFFQQESDDLSSCTICFEVYDRTVRKPKILPCAHTFCLPCLIVRNMFIIFAVFSVWQTTHLILIKRQLLRSLLSRWIFLAQCVKLCSNSVQSTQSHVSQRELVVVNRRLEETRAELDREKAKKIRLASPSRHQLRRKLAVKPNQHNVMMGNNNLTQHSSSSSHHHLLSTHSVWAYGESQQLFLHEPPKPPMQVSFLHFQQL